MSYVSAIFYPIFLDLLKFCAILPLEMETELTFIDILINILFFIGCLGLSFLITCVVDWFVDKGREGSKGYTMFPFF